MSSFIKIQIEQYEENLRQAMLLSDIPTLDKLLSPRLVFTNHLGQLMTKQNDLEAHQSGRVKISKIILSNQNITLHDEIAIVSVQARITGSFAGETSDSHFRFTRVWRQSSTHTWQIIAGHSSSIT